MKKTLLFLLLVSSSWAACPLYQYRSNPQINQEFQNTCQQILNPTVNSETVNSATMKSLTVSSETVTTKLTVPNGTASTDAAAFGQLPTILLQNHVFCQTSTNFTTASSVFSTTNLSCSITPTSANSRILILSSGNIHSNNANNTNMFLSIFRGNTNLGDATVGFGGISNGTTATQLGVPMAVVYQDTPLMAAATTYFVKIRSSDGLTNVSFPDSGVGNLLLVEVNP